jgi:hypothetical protein
MKYRKSLAAYVKVSYLWTAAAYSLLSAVYVQTGAPRIMV